MLDCVVVGVPDDRFGEAVIALVQAAGGRDLDAGGLDPADLERWCRGRISGFKRPKRFFVVDTLDRSAAGKANYTQLRKLAAELVTHKT